LTDVPRVARPAGGASASGVALSALLFVFGGLATAIGYRGHRPVTS
jgi:hypothetical protein